MWILDLYRGGFSQGLERGIGLRTFSGTLRGIGVLSRLSVAVMLSGPGWEKGAPPDEIQRTSDLERCRKSTVRRSFPDGVDESRSFSGRSEPSGGSKHLWRAGFRGAGCAMRCLPRGVGFDEACCRIHPEFLFQFQREPGRGVLTVGTVGLFDRVPELYSGERLTSGSSRRRSSETRSGIRGYS